MITHSIEASVFLSQCISTIPTLRSHGSVTKSVRNRRNSQIMQNFGQNETFQSNLWIPWWHSWLCQIKTEAWELGYTTLARNNWILITISIQILRLNYFSCFQLNWSPLAQQGIQVKTQPNSGGTCLQKMGNLLNVFLKLLSLGYISIKLLNSSQACVF